MARADHAADPADCLDGAGIPLPQCGSPLQKWAIISGCIQIGVCFAGHPHAVCSVSEIERTGPGRHPSDTARRLLRQVPVCDEVRQDQTSPTKEACLFWDRLPFLYSLSELLHILLLDDLAGGEGVFQVLVLYYLTVPLIYRDPPPAFGPLGGCRSGCIPGQLSPPSASPAHGLPPSGRSFRWCPAHPVAIEGTISANRQKHRWQ